VASAVALSAPDTVRCRSRLLGRLNHSRGRHLPGRDSIKPICRAGLIPWRSSWLILGCRRVFFATAPLFAGFGRFSFLLALAASAFFWSTLMERLDQSPMCTYSMQGIQEKNSGAAYFLDSLRFGCRDSLYWPHPQVEGASLWTTDSGLPRCTGCVCCSWQLFCRPWRSVSTHRHVGIRPVHGLLTRNGRKLSPRSRTFSAVRSCCYSFVGVIFY